MRGRDFLSVRDLNVEELLRLVTRAVEWKARASTGERPAPRLSSRS